MSVISPVTSRTLSNEIVDVIRVSLDPDPNWVSVYRNLLTTEECQRADRYVTDLLTRRFTVCRGVLRQMIGALLEMRPTDVRIVTGPHGKPAIATDHTDVEFNVSHTGDLALMAFTRRRPIGIDVEAIDQRQTLNDLAARFFSTGECEQYFSLPEQQRRAAFYRIWTCKEAFLKATGTGMSFPLGRFTVSAFPDHPPGLLAVEGDPEAPSRWAYVIPEVDAHHAAALAVQGHGWTLRTHVWQH